MSSPLAPMTEAIVQQLQQVAAQLLAAATPPDQNFLIQMWSILALNGLTIAILLVIFIRHAISSNMGFKSFQIYRSFRRDSHLYRTATILVWPLVSLLYSLLAVSLFVVLMFDYWKTGNPRALTSLNLASLVILGIGCWQVGGGLTVSSLDTLRVIRPHARLHLPHPTAFHLVQYGFCVVHIAVCITLTVLVEHYIQRTHNLSLTFVQGMALLDTIEPNPVALANLMNLTANLQSSNNNVFKYLQIVLIEFLAWISIFLAVYLPTSAWTIAMLRRSLRDHSSTSVSTSPNSVPVKIYSPVISKRDALLRVKLVNWIVKVTVSSAWAVCFIVITLYLTLNIRTILASPVENQVRQFILLPQCVNGAFSLLVAVTLALKPLESASDANQIEGHVDLKSAKRIPVQTVRTLRIDVQTSRETSPPSPSDYDFDLPKTKQPFYGYNNYSEDVKA